MADVAGAEMEQAGTGDMAVVVDTVLQAEQ